jgi:hypothetical protein
MERAGTIEKAAAPAKVAKTATINNRFTIIGAHTTKPFLFSQYCLVSFQRCRVTFSGKHPSVQASDEQTTAGNIDEKFKSENAKMLIEKSEVKTSGAIWKLEVNCFYENNYLGASH